MTKEKDWKEEFIREEKKVKEWEKNNAFYVKENIRLENEVSHLKKEKEALMKEGNFVFLNLSLVVIHPLPKHNFSFSSFFSAKSLSYFSLHWSQP